MYRSTKKFAFEDEDSNDEEIVQPKRQSQSMMTASARRLQKPVIEAEELSESEPSEESESEISESEPSEESETESSDFDSEDDDSDHERNYRKYKKY